MLDAHTHVQFAAYQNDWKEVIQRALASGVRMINVGTQRDTSKQAVDLAHQFESGVYAAVGLHPIHTTQSYHDAKELGEGPAAKAFTSRGEEFDPKFYLETARDPKVVAIGECGLDYYRIDKDTKEKQVSVFLQQVEIAKETGKALMIHCRPSFTKVSKGKPSKGTDLSYVASLEAKEDDAYEDLLQLLYEPSYNSISKVLHFYVGSVQMTKKFLDAGFYFEFGGVITFSRDYDEAIKLIPLDRLFLETDAPYVAPEPYRGKRNEPAYLIEVAKKMAELKGVSYTELDKQIDQNAKRVFGI